MKKDIGGFWDGSEPIRRRSLIPRDGRQWIRFLLGAASLFTVAATVCVLYLQLDRNRNETLRRLPVLGRLLAVPVEETPAVLPSDTVGTLPRSGGGTSGKDPRTAEADRQAALTRLSNDLPDIQTAAGKGKFRWVYDQLLQALDDFADSDSSPLVQDARYWLGVSAWETGRGEEGIRILEDLATKHQDQRAARHLALRYYASERYGRSRYFLEREAGPEASRMLERINREEKAVGGLRTLETDHCRVRYARVAHFRAARIASDQCENAVQLILDRFTVPFTGWKVTIKLVGKETFRLLTSDPDWIAEMYPHNVYLSEESLSPIDRVAGAVRHEVAHAVFGLARVRGPSWLREGLAGYIEHEMARPVAVGRFEGRVVRDGRRALHLSLFPTHFLRTAWMERRTDRGRLQSVSMVHYLIEQYGTATLDDALAALRNSEDVEQDLSDILKTKPGELYTGWKRSLRKRWRRN